MVLRAVDAEDSRELISTKNEPFSFLLSKANSIQDVCHDYQVSKVTNHNMMYDNGILSFIEDGNEIVRHGMSRYAFSQLSSKVGVPPSYLQKCLDTGRVDLVSDNLNSWIGDYGKDLFIREYDGRIRGVLSGKYSVLDTPDILKVLYDAVDLSKYHSKGSFLNEERFHLRLVGKENLLVDGEELFPGIFIDSSDVGRSMLTVCFGIYKQVCTNGLIISRGSGTLFQQKHIGISSEQFYEGLRKSLVNVDELVEHSVERVQRAKGRYNHWSVSSQYEDEIQEFINYIRQKTNLSNESAAKVISLMQTKYEDTRWGLINGITEVAQDFTLERRLELEKIAGDLLVA